MQPVTRWPARKPVFLARPKPGPARSISCPGWHGPCPVPVPGPAPPPVGRHGPARSYQAGPVTPTGGRPAQPSWPGEGAPGQEYITHPPAAPPARNPSPQPIPSPRAHRRLDPAAAPRPQEIAPPPGRLRHSGRQAVTRTAAPASAGGFSSSLPSPVSRSPVPSLR